MANLWLADVSHYTMRHTGVTMMLESGINPRVISYSPGGRLSATDSPSSMTTI
jgi:site-specific recombinase XerD